MRPVKVSTLARQLRIKSQDLHAYMQEMFGIGPKVHELESVFADQLRGRLRTPEGKTYFTEVIAGKTLAGP